MKEGNIAGLCADVVTLVGLRNSKPCTCFCVKYRQEAP